MAYWKSLALTLRVLEYSETSLIVQLFTRERGRVSAIAKGARRRGSKFAGEIEAVTLVEVVCARGRDPASMHTLTELDVRETLRGARQDLARLYAAADVVELVREAAPEGEPLPEVFDLAAGALRRIADLGAPFDGTAVLAFEARLLDLLGLFPRLDACVACGAGERPFFSPRAGGVLCAACRDRRDPGTRDVSAGALHALGILGREPDKAARLKLAAGQREELRRLLGEYLSAALEKDMKLGRYLV